MAVRIVTSSTAGIPPQLARELGVYTSPELFVGIIGDFFLD